MAVDSAVAGAGAAPEFPAYEQLRPVTPLAGIVLCDNPSPMTMEGTNSVVLRAAPDAPAVVIDPGPVDDAHAARLAEIAGEVALVLVTHRHPDHTGGIDELHRLTGAPVRAIRAEFCRSAEPLGDGQVLDVAGLRLTVFATPGHTADSIAVGIAAAGADPAAGDDAGRFDSIMLADTILGRDSTVLDAEDGSLVDYLDSLELLERVGAGVIGLPSHGPDVPDVAEAAAALAAHRRKRLDQVRAAVAELGEQATAGELTRHIYTEVTDPVLLGAAEQSTRVALDYIVRRG